MKANNSRFFITYIFIFSTLLSCNRNKEGQFVTSARQFLNSGFEQKSAVNLPLNWKLASAVGYIASQVNDIHHLGAYSLKIIGKPNDAMAHVNVSQKLAIDYKQVKRVRLAAYIKTEQLKGNVVLWYNLADAKKKEIDFGNSESLGAIATGTKDWQRLSIEIPIEKDAKNIVFGAYIRGTGTVWLDDFSIEEYHSTMEEPPLEIVKLNNEFIDIVKNNSIYKDSIDWKGVDKDLIILGKGLKRPGDVSILNNYVLQQLRKAGDNHSFIQNNITAQNYASGKVAQPKPKARFLTDGIGYISVPSFSSINQNEMEGFASNIQTLIKNLDLENNIKGWIVDLRTNTGGNMHPMIFGLLPLLDTGTLGYFVKDTTASPWPDKKYGMGIKIKNPYRIKNKDNNIAVLIGQNTGSSGEMTAISFAGQRNVKLFGEPSAGYVTANQMFKLSDGSNLLLATRYVADRNHKKYLEKVYPDILVKSFDNQDNVLKKAKFWLSEK